MDAPAQDLSLDVPVRPRTRGECLGGERPCPFLGCTHHVLAGLVAPALATPGSHVGRPPTDDELLALLDQLPDTCTLDVADRGGATLEEVSGLLVGSDCTDPGVTRERTRQIETKALGKLRTPVRLAALPRPEDVSRDSATEPWQWHGRTDVPGGTMDRGDGRVVQDRLRVLAPPVPRPAPRPPTTGLGAVEALPTAPIAPAPAVVPTAAPSATATTTTATPPDPAPTAASEPAPADTPTATEPPEAAPPTAATPSTCSHDDCNRPAHPGAVHRKDLCLPHLRGWLATRTAYQRAALAASAPTTTATPAPKEPAMSDTCSVPGCKKPPASHWPEGHPQACDPTLWPLCTRHRLDAMQKRIRDKCTTEQAVEWVKGPKRSGAKAAPSRKAVPRKPVQRPTPVAPKPRPSTSVPAPVPTLPAGEPIYAAGDSCTLTITLPEVHPAVQALRAVGHLGGLDALGRMSRVVEKFGGIESAERVAAVWSTRATVPE